MPATASPTDVPASRLQAGSRVCGFTVGRVTPMPSLRATVVEATHGHSGARVLHVFTEDTENLCAVAFRTPPPDDTGVPHILEHSVLGGSEKYPVKDPFLEMLKRSMATFINAFTYPDKTVYPVSSNVRQDFFNLVAVYLDAVFHPTITAETLKQEGHHLEFADPANPESPLLIKGIVYNEMKGAYSELDSLIERVSGQALFPDSPYGRDAGGDPDAIPTLTYERFRNFYERLYHPANSFIVLYGNVPTEESLAFLDERLATMPPPPQDLDSSIRRQPRWTAPREREELYPIGAEEPAAGKAAVMISWLAGDGLDPVAEMGMEVLDNLLLGHDGAPLHRALIESHLGEDLAPSGFSTGTMESSFHLGLKGTEPERKDAILKLVTETLERVAAEGFSRDRVEAAFQQLRYAELEITAQYPLRVMNRVYEGWIYGLDPLAYLRLGEVLDELWRWYEQDTELFSRLIRERLLDTPHRLVTVFKPDPQLQARRDAAFAAAMQARKDAMSAEERQAVVRETEALRRRQEAPNSPEALATLPVLHLGDLPKAPREIPFDLTAAGPGVPLLLPRVFANGVNYFVLAFDLAGLPDDLWLDLPLFADLFNKLGTSRADFAVMGERITACTGGLGASVFTTAAAREPDRLLPFLAVSFKALDRRYSEALVIVRDLLLELNLADVDRIRDLAIQAKVQRQSGIIDGGHVFSMQHAARTLSPLAALNARLGGLTQVRLAGRLARRFDEEIEGVRQRLEAIRRFLLQPGRMRAAFTGGSQPAAATAAWLGEFAASFGTASSSMPAASWPAPLPAPRREGLALASEVAFCAECMPAPAMTSPDAPPLLVFAQLLGLGYLWEEIRAKGGAYGGMASYDPTAQVFGMMSYRDPNIARTLGVFHELPAVLGHLPLTADEVERGIISVAKVEERPVRPAAATSQVLWRHLTGLTSEVRRERYAALLEVTGPAVRAAAERLVAQGEARRQTCVLAGRPMLDAFNAAVAPADQLAVENILEDGDDDTAAPE